MLTPHATISTVTDADGTHLLVSTTWSGPGLDRVDGYGVTLRPTKGALAARLKSAIDAGAAFPDPVLKTDVNGKTYVSHGLAVLGRRLNADLKALGF